MMHPFTATKLAAAEYDFARVDLALADLADLLHACAEAEPACTQATLNVRSLRKRLLRVWKAVAPSVTVAQAIAETLEAPF